MEGFPYPLRPGQADIIQAIRDAQTQHGHALIESATGTGKTVTSLYASLQTIGADGRRVIYATRTNSQQQQVVREHAALEAQTLLVPMMGRKHYCPLLKDDPRFKNGTADELGRLCRDAKQKAMQAHATGKPVDGACPYYERLLHDGPGPVEAILRSEGDLVKQVAAAGSCAYEALKLLLPEAHVVVVPYVFLIDGRLRDALMQWMGTTPEGCHVILDEAHNLPEAVRSHHSPRLGLITVERAIREAEKLQDPILGGTTLASTFLTTLHQVIRDLVKEHAADADDGWMPADALDEALMMALRMPGPGIQRIIRDLDAWGEAVREQKRKAKRLPRSYLGAVAGFLAMWRLARDAPYVHLTLREDGPALEAYLLEPASRLGWLLEMASTTHMSGTLAPMEAYRSETGLPRASEHIIEGGLDPRHLRVFGWQGMVRSHAAIQEDPSIVERHQNAGRALLATWQGRSGIWFPSHKMLQDYLEEGFLHGIGYTIYQEEPGMTTPDLLDLVARFRADAGDRVALVGVLGGRLTEGIDYPGDAMAQALLMGVPYPKPTARSQALIHHYESRTGNGWAIAVHGPVGRVLRQAVGRLVRGPEDEGVAVVLDDRIQRFRDRFPHLHMIQEATGAQERPEPKPGAFVTGNRYEST
ncbi:MAG: ATP-dependent DNA helicase [Thermoplasmatota archaeon]